MELPEWVSQSNRQRIENSLAGADETRSVSLEDVGRGEIGVTEVVVEKLPPERKFEKRGGGEGRVRSVHISDSTMMGMLQFWDGDCDTPNRLGLRVGAKLRLRGISTSGSFQGMLQFQGGDIEVVEMPTESYLPPTERAPEQKVAPSVPSHRLPKLPKPQRSIFDY